jgi:hypothetical protein
VSLSREMVRDTLPDRRDPTGIPGVVAGRGQGGGATQILLLALRRVGFRVGRRGVLRAMDSCCYCGVGRLGTHKFRVLVSAPRWMSRWTLGSLHRAGAGVPTSSQGPQRWRLSQRARGSSGHTRATRRWGRGTHACAPGPGGLVPRGGIGAYLAIPDEAIATVHRELSPGLPSSCIPKFPPLLLGLGGVRSTYARRGHASPSNRSVILRSSLTAATPRRPM